MIALLLLTFYGIQLVRVNKNAFREEWVRTDCTLSKYSFMTEADVSTDYNLKSKEGFVECYCKLDPIGLSTKVFPLSNNAKICSEWLDKKYNDFLFSVEMAAFIVLVNNLFRIIFNFFGDWDKFEYFSQELTVRVLRIFAAQFINTILVITVMNARIEGLEILGPLESIVSQFISGFYIDFTPTWFRDVGNIIVLVMIINIFVAPFGIMMSYLYKVGKRWYYQKFTLSRRITRAKTQSEYQKLYSGPEFILDGRYAEILNLVFVAFTFSPAIPVLYFVALANLMVLYWVDKFLILRVTIRPKKLSEKLEQTVVSVLMWSILPHLLMAVWIYGSPKIFNENLDPNALAKAFLSPKTNDLYIQEDNPLNEFRDRLSRPHSIFLTLLLLSIIALAFLL